MKGPKTEIVSFKINQLLPKPVCAWAWQGLLLLHCEGLHVPLQCPYLEPAWMGVGEVVVCMRMRMALALANQVSHPLDLWSFLLCSWLQRQPLVSRLAWGRSSSQVWTFPLCNRRNFKILKNPKFYLCFKYSDPFPPAPSYGEYWLTPACPFYLLWGKHQDGSDLFAKKTIKNGRCL